MTPDQKFARWIKYSCVVFVLVFAYFLVADLAMPLTPQAMATRVVTKVAPVLMGKSPIFMWQITKKFKKETCCSKSIRSHTS